MLEFFAGLENEDFLDDVLQAITEIQPKLLDAQDIWMNDEIMLTYQSTQGDFLISKDIWDFAFIMTDNNQPVLYKIDQLLQQHPKFTKVAMDFTAYKSE